MWVQLCLTTGVAKTCIAKRICMLTQFVMDVLHGFNLNQIACGNSQAKSLKADVYEMLSIIKIVHDNHHVLLLM